MKYWTPVLPSGNVRPACLLCAAHMRKTARPTEYATCSIHSVASAPHNAKAHVCAHAPTHIQMHARMVMRVCMQKHMLTYTHMYTHIHMHAHTQARVAQLECNVASRDTTIEQLHAELASAQDQGELHASIRPCAARAHAPPCQPAHPLLRCWGMRARQLPFSLAGVTWCCSRPARLLWGPASRRT